MTLQQIIDDSSRIVFFGGAGVSTESGIPDFRSADGLYNQRYKYPPEQIVSRSFYMSHTEEFYRFYRDRMIFPDAKPNAAHRKLAELEWAGKLSCVITQNIDGLHQAAGSLRVVELHGSVHRNYCEECGKLYPLSAVTECRGVPTCSCGGRIKPDVVLYEEQLKEQDINRAVDEISAADTLIIGGTSLAVYPAAGLIRYFRGRHLVVINKTPTSADESADLVISESIGEVFSRIRAIRDITPRERVILSALKKRPALFMGSASFSVFVGWYHGYDLAKSHSDEAAELLPCGMHEFAAQKYLGGVDKMSSKGWMTVIEEQEPDDRKALKLFFEFLDEYLIYLGYEPIPEPDSLTEEEKKLLRFGR